MHAHQHCIGCNLDINILIYNVRDTAQSEFSIFTTNKQKVHSLVRVHNKIIQHNLVLQQQFFYENISGE